MLVNWLIARAKRTPYFHLPGYMNRWWLVPYRQAGSWSAEGACTVSWWRQPIAWLLQTFGIAVRIHEILRSDEGRDPHDHPWPYLTVILRGGYTEERYNADGELASVKWHDPGSILYRPANSWHRLTLPPGSVTTTLFVTGRYCNGWGFNVDGAKVPYKQYLGDQP